MKRLIGVLIVFLMLTGCSEPVWETVSDPAEIGADTVWQEHAYTLQIGVPDGVSLVEETAEGRLYATEDGELEIETRTFLTSGVDQAIRELSGYVREDLTVLQTQRFGLPEYQFAWVAQTESGSRLYRADLVLDGTCCYAVVCSSLEEAGDYYAFQARQVFSSFGLSEQETV